MENFKIPLNKYYKLGELMEWLGDTYGVEGDDRSFQLLDCHYNEIYYSGHVYKQYSFTEISVKELRKMGFNDIIQPKAVGFEWHNRNTYNVLVSNFELRRHCWTIILADLNKEKFDKLYNEGNKENDENLRSNDFIKGESNDETRKK